LGWREEVKRDVTLCVATLVTRKSFRERALASVRAQIEPPVALRVAFDMWRVGAAATRNHAMKHTYTTWVAFLDDDDELLPHHFKHLLDVAEATNADLVYPWFEAIRDGVVIPDVVIGRGQLFDPELLKRHNCIPPEIIVKRELVEAVGGFPTPNTAEWPYPDCEDWGLWRKLSDAGAHIVHTPEITWRWHHHDDHTRGLGTRR